MAVMIRLQRTGKRNAPSYRVVAVEKHSKRDGKTLALLGFYNPNMKPDLIQLDKAEIGKWIKNGAKPSLIVQKLLDNKLQLQ